MNTSWKPPVRPEWAHHQPYGAPQLEVDVTLNVNENPFPPSPTVRRAIRASVEQVTGQLNRYPDRDAGDLRGKLAHYLGHGLTADNVWAANGSNEIMVQLLQLFGGPGRSAMIFPPTYSMYPEYARLTHTTLVESPRQADFSLDPHAVARDIAREQPDVVILTSPNNPTGTSASAELLDTIVAVARGIVIVDEAYAEFTRDATPTALNWLADHQHVVVVRTMSKAFALAGARLGYAAADPAIVRALLTVRLPYHLSAVTQAVASAALDHHRELLGQVDVLRHERDLLSQWLRDRGYQVAESDANFLLFGIFDNRREVWERLLNEGILIRETGPEGWLRVSIGTPEENQRFKRALEVT